MPVIPLRAWLGLAALLALAGILWHDHWMTRRYNAKAAEVRTVTATLEQERKAREIEQADKRKADETARTVQAELDRIHAEPRITGVRLCPRLPSSASQSGGAGGAEGTAPGRVEGAAEADTGPAGRDISDELDAYANDCAAVGAIARGWHEWDAGRTH